MNHATHTHTHKTFFLLCHRAVTSYQLLRISKRFANSCVTRDRWICAIHRLRCAIDGSINCAPIGRSRNHRSIVQSSIDRATTGIARSTNWALLSLRNYRSIAHYCACAIDGWNMLHVLWCETVLQLLRHYLKPVASFTTIASC